MTIKSNRNVANIIVSTAIEFAMIDMQFSDEYPYDKYIPINVDTMQKLSSVMNVPVSYLINEFGSCTHFCIKDNLDFTNAKLEWLAYMGTGYFPYDLVKEYQMYEAEDGTRFNCVEYDNMVESFAIFYAGWTRSKNY